MSIYLGLMSGTSLDGVDVAAVSFEGDEERPRAVEPLMFRSSPYDPSFRDRIRRAIAEGPASSLCDLDFDLDASSGPRHWRPWRLRDSHPPGCEPSAVMGRPSGTSRPSRLDPARPFSSATRPSSPR